MAGLFAWHAILRAERSGRRNRADRAGIDAGAAVDASVGIDHTCCALLADGVDRAGRIAGAAVDALLRNFVSHGGFTSSRRQSQADINRFAEICPHFRTELISPPNTSTATAAGGRFDRETFAPGGGHVVEDLVAGKGLDLLIEQHFETVDRHCGFIVLWLIQSQPQTGAASAKAFKNDAQELPLVLLEDRSQLFLGQIGDLHLHILSRVVITFKI